MSAPIGTQPPALLAAMLAMIQRNGRTDAVRVTGYLERSYNTGHCVTCSEIASEVRIFYVREDGSKAYYQDKYRGLAEVIRDLTDDPAESLNWGAAATFEPSDIRWGRAGLHGFDEMPSDE